MGFFFSVVDPDPDVRDRIRTLALINDPIVCAKAKNTSEISFA
jgi:hypothetical protein